jgi:hypothetical protein
VSAPTWQPETLAALRATWEAIDATLLPTTDL